jgi:hypothetical protein
LRITEEHPDTTVASKAIDKLIFLIESFSLVSDQIRVTAFIASRFYYRRRT